MISPARRPVARGSFRRPHTLTNRGSKANGIDAAAAWLSKSDSIHVARQGRDQNFDRQRSALRFPTSSARRRTCPRQVPKWCHLNRNPNHSFWRRRHPQMALDVAHRRPRYRDGRFVSRKVFENAGWHLRGTVVAVLLRGQNRPLLRSDRVDHEPVIPLKMGS